MKRIISLAAVLALTAACGTTADDPGPEPRDFALTLPVEAAEGAAVQQIVLPAAALVALKRADRSDIRLFDAGGRPVSVALLTDRGTRLEETRLEAIAVKGPGGGGSSAGVSVRVARDGQTVTVDSGGVVDAGATRSVLLDTRELNDPVQSIALDADLPKQQPVAFTIEDSADLKVWHPVAEQVLFRPGDGPALLGSGRIALAGIMLEDRYLRVSWSEAPEATLRGATIYTASSPPLARITVPATGQELGDSHHLTFGLPSGPAPAALRVIMTGKDGVMPIRLLGRSAVDEPWTLLAVNRLQQDEKGAVLEFAGSTKKQFLLEADPRGAGFSQAPRLEFIFDPIVLLAAFNGNPPYRLAVGNSTSSPRFFAISDLTSGLGPYPLAQVGSREGQVSIDLAHSADSSATTVRTLALWLALIAGVLVLAFAAYRLFRANSADT